MPKDEWVLFYPRQGVAGPETWASWKLRHCKVSGCTAKIVLRKYCEEHGRKELGDERFDTLLTVHKCKEIDCDSHPAKAGYCVVLYREFYQNI